MTLDKAKQIGSRLALKSVLIGLLIAQLIMTYMQSIDRGIVTAFFWFNSFGYQLNIFIGAVAMLLCGHYFGQLAGKAILIRKYNFILVGLVCSMAVLLTTAFISGWTGFFQEGLQYIGTEENPFLDYIYKPFFWITLFGFIPVIIVGVWFGYRIKKIGAEK